VVDTRCGTSEPCWRPSRAANFTTTILPIVVFGFLDVMYIAIEKAYRDLHSHITAAIRDRSYSLAMAFEVKASWDGGTLVWALASWSIFPYCALVVCFILANVWGWPALLAKP